MVTGASVQTGFHHGRLVLLAVAAGGLVSLLLGVYGTVHTPTGARIALLGFGSMIEMKVWLGATAGVLALLQLVTALWMYGRLGMAAPARLGTVHKTLGALALVVTLPVAYHCLWSIGFEDYTPRVLLHSLAGCLVYGTFVVKVVGLHARSAPSWLVAVAGGALFTLLVVTVLTSAVWYVATVGPPGGGAGY